MQVRPVLPALLLFVSITALSACGGAKGEVTILGPEASDRAPQEWVEAFTEAMDNNQPRFLACYETALKADPAVQGTVTVKIELGAPSIPYSVDNTTGSESLAECVVESAPSKIYLGSPPGGHLKFRVQFSPKE
jgi:hypothetical protein